MNKIIIVGLAGACGAMSRYALSGLAHRIAGEDYPWGTLLVNVVGCLLFGFIWVLGEKRMAFTPENRLYILTGFMGAFTTFSAFAFETGQMFRDSQFLLAASNIAANNVLCIVALFAGLALASLL